MKTIDTCGKKTSFGRQNTTNDLSCIDKFQIQNLKLHKCSDPVALMQEEHIDAPFSTVGRERRCQIDVNQTFFIVQKSINKMRKRIVMLEMITLKYSQ